MKTGRDIFVRAFALALCPALITLIFSGCKPDAKEEILPEEVTIVGELAYDANPSLEYTVLIDEAGISVPYLVLTNNYNDSGNTLLLRKYIMDETRRYNDMFYGSAYYNGSEIDIWLSTEFLKTLGDLDIATSTINITIKDARETNETEDIDRKIFLLSRGEVCGGESSVSPANGVRLDYFRSLERNHTRAAVEENEKRSATMADGTPCAWSLRSVDITHNTLGMGVADNGTYGNGGVDYENGVRPAFCLASVTEVERVSHEIYGEVFAIKR